MAKPVYRFSSKATNLDHLGTYEKEWRWYVPPESRAWQLLQGIEFQTYVAAWRHQWDFLQRGAFFCEAAAWHLNEGAAAQWPEEEKLFLRQAMWLERVRTAYDSFELHPNKDHRVHKTVAQVGQALIQTCRAHIAFLGPILRSEDPPMPIWKNRVRPPELVSQYSKLQEAGVTKIPPTIVFAQYPGVLRDPEVAGEMERQGLVI